MSLYGCQNEGRRLQGTDTADLRPCKPYGIFELDMETRLPIEVVA